eukprot:364021-Chlamydomonas_euryale.AAC.2
MLHSVSSREAQQQRQHSKTFAITRKRRKEEGGLERRCARCQCLKWEPSPLDGQKRTPRWATSVHHGQASLGRQLPVVEAHDSGPAATSICGGSGAGHGEQHSREWRRPDQVPQGRSPPAPPAPAQKLFIMTLV